MPAFFIKVDTGTGFRRGSCWDLHNTRLCDNRAEATTMCAMYIATHVCVCVCVCVRLCNVYLLGCLSARLLSLLLLSLLLLCGSLGPHWGLGWHELFAKIIYGKLLIVDIGVPELNSSLSSSYSAAPSPDPTVSLRVSMCVEFIISCEHICCCSPSETKTRNATSKTKAPTSPASCSGPQSIASFSLHYPDSVSTANPSHASTSTAAPLFLPAHCLLGYAPATRRLPDDREATSKHVAALVS